MIRKRGQISVEYLIVIGFIVFVVISLFAVAFFYASNIRESIRMTQVEGFANKMISNARAVFYSGPPSRTSTDAYLPDGVSAVLVDDNGKALLIFDVTTDAGITRVAYDFDVPISGSLSASPGVNSYDIVANPNGVEFIQTSSGGTGSGGGTCGDNSADPGEECDGIDLNGGSCVTEGFYAGSLSCTGCLYDTSGCHNCGNSVVDAGEVCDDGALNGQIGYCNSACTGIVGSGTIVMLDVVVDASASSNIVVDGDYARLSVDETGNLPYDSLYGYWSFDADIADTTAFDYSANGRDMAYEGTSATTSGKYGRATIFNGDDGDSVTRHDVHTIVEDSAFAGQDLTISAWVNKGTINDDSMIVAREKALGNKNFHFYLNSGNNLEFRIWDDSCSAGDLFYLTTGTVGVGWHHVAVTLNNNGAVNLYIDGNREGPFGSGLGLASCLMETTIGGRQRGDGSGAHRSFTGSIDEVMIFFQELTPTEISDIYNEQSGRYELSGWQEFSNIVMGIGDSVMDVELDDYLSGGSFTIQFDWDKDGSYTGSETTEYSFIDEGTLLAVRGIDLTADPDNDFNVRLNYYSDSNRFNSALAKGNPGNLVFRS